MDRDMRATWVVQGHGGWPWHKTDSFEDTMGRDGTYTAYLFPSPPTTFQPENMAEVSDGFYQIGSSLHL